MSDICNMKGSFDHISESWWFEHSYWMIEIFVWGSSVRVNQPKKSKPGRSSSSDELSDWFRTTTFSASASCHLHSQTKCKRTGQSGFTKTQLVAASHGQACWTASSKKPWGSEFFLVSQAQRRTEDGAKGDCYLSIVSLSQQVDSGVNQGSSTLSFIVHGVVKSGFKVKYLLRSCFEGLRNWFDCKDKEYNNTMKPETKGLPKKLISGQKQETGGKPWEGSCPCWFFGSERSCRTAHPGSTVLPFQGMLRFSYLHWIWVSIPLPSE